MPKEVPVIRWMAAFRNRRTPLAESLTHELTLSPEMVVAGEPIWCRSRLRHSEALVGLLVDQDQTDLIRAYEYDVFSTGNTVETLDVATPTDRVCVRWCDLHRLGRNRRHNIHGECLIRRVKYAAIVVGRKASYKDYKTAASIAAQFAIPLISLREGNVP